MSYERVHMVWDIYDGVRSGLADFGDGPHYFCCEHDSSGSDGYSDVFGLWPIDQQFLALAQEQWSLYKAWEYRHHSGEVSVATHPGHRGQIPRYDELQDYRDRFLGALGVSSFRAIPTFRARADQQELPPGCLREIEVEWTVA